MYVVPDFDARAACLKMVIVGELFSAEIEAKSAAARGLAVDIGSSLLSDFALIRME
jgi:hypothetical protein